MSCESEVVSYVKNDRTVRRPAIVLNDPKGADEMSNHDEWTSYSHWGMFTLDGNVHSRPLERRAYHQPADVPAGGVHHRG